VDPQPDPVTQWLKDLARDRYSAATITARRRLLATISDPLTIDHQGIEEWWNSRQVTHTGERRTASSLIGEASHLRTFYRWAMQHDLISYNPADWLPKIRTTTTTATVIREPDLLKAIRNADPNMARMLVLGAMAGLRSAEIGAVTWGDIDPSLGVLHVRQGKGGKDRTVPLSGNLLAELGDPSEGLIIASSTGRQMSAKASPRASDAT